MKNLKNYGAEEYLDNQEFKQEYKRLLHKNIRRARLIDKKKRKYKLWQLDHTESLETQVM